MLGFLLGLQISICLKVWALAGTARNDRAGIAEVMDLLHFIAIIED